MSLSDDNTPPRCRSPRTLFSSDTQLLREVWSPSDETTPISLFLYARLNFDRSVEASFHPLFIIQGDFPFIWVFFIRSVLSGTARAHPIFLLSQDVNRILGYIRDLQGVGVTISIARCLSRKVCWFAEGCHYTKGEIYHNLRFRCLSPHSKQQ